MRTKLKKLIGLGCVAASLVSGTASAEIGFLCGGDCYLGGSFGKGFTGKKISGKNIPIMNDVGLSNSNDTLDLSYKNGNAFSLFFGTKKDNLRYQVELSSVKTRYKDVWNNNESTGFGRVDMHPLQYEFTRSISVIPQVFHDFSVPKLKELTPYVGVGLGYSKVKNHAIGGGVNAETTTNENKAAGQFVAGIKYQFTDNLAAAVDYKYFRILGKVKALNSSYYNHSVQLGLVVNI